MLDNDPEKKLEAKRKEAENDATYFRGIIASQKSVFQARLDSLTAERDEVNARFRECLDELSAAKEQAVYWMNAVKPRDCESDPCGACSKCYDNMFSANVSLGEQIACMSHDVTEALADNGALWTQLEDLYNYCAPPLDSPEYPEWVARTEDARLAIVAKHPGAGWVSLEDWNDLNAALGDANIAKAGLEVERAAMLAELERLRKLECQRVTNTDFVRLELVAAKGEAAAARGAQLRAELGLDEKHQALLADVAKAKEALDKSLNGHLKQFQTDFYIRVALAALSRGVP